MLVGFEVLAEFCFLGCKVVWPGERLPVASIMLVSWLACSSTLQMKAMCSSEM
jgi:hypothetical protein